jgi:hypothetical protein
VGCGGVANTVLKQASNRRLAACIFWRPEVVRTQQASYIGGLSVVEEYLGSLCMCRCGCDPLCQDDIHWLAPPAQAQLSWRERAPAG